MHHFTYRNGVMHAEAVDLIEVVQRDQAHSSAQRHRELGLGLGVAVQHDPLGREARAQGQVQLAAGGHVAPQSLLRKQSEDRRARERLRRKQHIAVGVAL